MWYGKIYRVRDTGTPKLFHYWAINLGRSILEQNYTFPEISTGSKFSRDLAASMGGGGGGRGPHGARDSDPTRMSVDHLDSIRASWNLDPDLI